MKTSTENIININSENIVRWDCFDVQKQKIVKLTNKEFAEGIKNNWVKLRGEFLIIGNNNQKIWVDGIIK